MMNTFKFFIPLSAACIALFGASNVLANENHDHGPAPSSVAVPVQKGSDMADGEVRKVDLATKKIILKHGEIKNLGMGAMTMVFQVSDPALLDQVKAGDKVHFRAEQIKGAFVVTTIERVEP